MRHPRCKVGDKVRLSAHGFKEMGAMKAAFEPPLTRGAVGQVVQMLRPLGQNWYAYVVWPGSPVAWTHTPSDLRVVGAS